MYSANNEHVYIQIEKEVQNVENHSVTLTGWVYRYTSSPIMAYTGPIYVEGWLNTNDGRIHISWSGNLTNTTQIGVARINTTVEYPANSVNQSLNGLLNLETISGSGPYVYGSSIPINWTLSKLPINVSAPTLSSASVNFNSSVNIVTSDSDNASLKYDITYSFGTASGTIGSNLAAGTKAWTVPNSLMSQIPSSTSGVIKIAVKAKNENGDELASWQLDLTANVPSTVKPTVSATSISEAATIPSAISGTYVQSKSKLSVSHTAAGAYGSTITKYVTTIAGTSYNGASFTSNVIQTSGTVAVTVTVTDSRGRTGTRTTNVTVVAYTAPKITAVSAYRCTSSSSNTAKVDGGYICVKPTGNISAVSNKNTRECKVYYKQSSASSYSNSAITMSDYVLDTEYLIFTADINKSFDIYITLKDAFSTTTFYAPQVSSGGAYIHIPEDRSGMGLGKRRESSGNIETSWNFKSNGDIVADADGRPISLMTAGVRLVNYYTSRPTTLDCPHESDGSMVHYKATSSATTRPSDGHVLHFNWDNTGEWDAELFLSNSHTSTMFVRGKNANAGTWDAWNEVVTTKNIERLVMTSSSANITAASITDVTTTIVIGTVAKTGKLVLLQFAVQLKSQTTSYVTIPANTTLATIPSGYRPITKVRFPRTTTSYLIIDTNGNIYLDSSYTATTAANGSSLTQDPVLYICA